MKNNIFDQFYTNPRICERIVKEINNLFDLTKFYFIEPAAGTGNFIDALYKIGIDIEKVKAYDIDPKSNSKILKQDFLKLDISKISKYKSKSMVISNPPFGKRCDLAIKFLNKSLEIADIVCMILPMTFTRYSVQSKIKSDAKLIYSINIPENSFLVNNCEYSVKCVFQIWTNKNVNLWLSDQRKVSNKLDINDLKLYIYNNTNETLKYFNKKKYKWDFAVVRQGYYDYNEKITNPSKLKSNRQYLFIKCENKYIMDLINKINFKELANKNTTILGFSNSDLISQIYEKHIYKILRF